LAVARIRGDDAALFLHGQLSADIMTLDHGGATFACYCSPRGQVYGLLLVCRSADEFRLVGNAELLPAMLKRLQMFVLRARVTLEAADDLSVSALPTAESVARPGVDFQAAGLDLMYSVAAADSRLTVASVQWKEQELRRNIAWLDSRTSERFIPQMLGFDRIGAVSFGKGCYPGQEIIARARYLGQVKRKPLLLQVAGAPDLAGGDSVQLRDGQNWLQASVVDSVTVRSAEGAAETLVFLVSPVPGGAVEALEHEEISYRSATI
jgi:folate-binding protein YgfZ